MRRRCPTLFHPTVWVLALACLPALAQQDFSQVEIKTTKLADHLYMLEGAGGNLGLSIGPDGAFLVDDQFAPLSEKILAAVAEIGPQPVRFVLNTHWHFDHTGGNENMGKAGAVVVAHENVRQRMSTGGLIELLGAEIEPSPSGALPIVTFEDSLSFHVNGEEIHAFHVASAHTDGDAIVHFRGSDVLHLGDLLFSGGYPFIDTSSGGSIDGLIAAISKVLAMAEEETRFIAGHGPVLDRAGLVAYLTMLEGMRAEVAKLVAAGKSLGEAVAAKPSAGFDEAWGGGFMDPDKFVTSIYTSLTAR